MNYLVSKKYDLAFFLLPTFYSFMVAIGLEQWSITWSLQAQQVLQVVIFFIFVLGFDVSHVYASVYRIYFDKSEFRRRRFLYLGTPVIILVISCSIYLISALLFWRVLAYFAVIHFIRQQWGFISIYNHLNQKQNFNRLYEVWFDKAALYAGTLYPIIYWHTHLPRKFEWFVKNNFIALPIEIDIIARFIAIIIMLGWVINRIFKILKYSKYNLGKDLVMTGTWLVWFGGIVMYNSDLVFSITNISIHGISYVALIRITSIGFAKKKSIKSLTFFSKSVIRFLLLLFLLAYLEEFLWDNLVWFEHQNIFVRVLPNNSFVKSLAWVIIPLLSLPQITHYIIDGFIWKMNEKKNPYLKEILFSEKH